MSVTDDLPGGPMASRPVHFFWLVDTSSSMSVDGRMGKLDHAIKESIPEMRTVASENPGAQLLVRVLGFASGTRWIHPDPVPVDEFFWTPIEPDGLTDLGMALSDVAAQLEVPPMPDRALPPVICIVTDGMPTDDWRRGLADLDRSTWGKKAVRIAISVDTDETNDILSEFTGNPELVFNPTSPEELARAIRWASTVAVKVASDTSGGGDATATLGGFVVNVDADDRDIDDDDTLFV